MRIEDVKDLIIPAQFGADEDNCETYAMEEVYDQLDETVETAYGASKFVIFFEGLNEIVKIPFNGSFFYPYDDETGEYLNKEVFDPYYTEDYCEVEAAIYKDAEYAGLEMFFAATRYAGKTASGTPYYISDRVNTHGSYKRGSEDSRKKAEKLFHNSCCALSAAFLEAAIECYGEEATRKLLDFIEDEEISDLHSANVGVREDGSPVILDYSSFHS